MKLLCSQSFLLSSFKNRFKFYRYQSIFWFGNFSFILPCLQKREKNRTQKLVNKKVRIECTYTWYINLFLQMERQMRCELARKTTSRNNEDCRQPKTETSTTIKTTTTTSTTPTTSTILNSSNTELQKQTDQDEGQSSCLISVDEYSSRELPRLEKENSALQTVIEKLVVEVTRARLLGDVDDEEDLLKQWVRLVDSRNEILQKKHRILFLQQAEHLEKECAIIKRQLRNLEVVKYNNNVTTDNENVTKHDKIRNETEAQLISQLASLVRQRNDLVEIEMKTLNFATAERQRDKEILRAFLSNRYGEADINSDTVTGISSKSIANGNVGSISRWLQGITSRLLKQS